ncbi:hypothetical protein DSM112329_03107 [Paraconexibacter sp. AEG42_29]|uniref:Uncharacterized protein n=1 Tax=Paraconexibacter sp. AEG42_29 TaxID=2997339 RepID=A0AAU7AX76_9ACTN
MRQAIPSSRRSWAAVAAATTVVGASAALLALSGAASAQDAAFAVRGIGVTKLDTGPAITHHLTVSCVAAGTNTFVDCVPTGTAKITVDAATKKKLKLTSATLGTAKVVAKAATGEGEDGGAVDVKASAAVRKKLAKVKSVKVTYTVTVTAPVPAVLKTSGTWSVNTFTGAKRLLLRSPGDSVDLAGGGRG